jgi:hypothetical protein
MDDLSLERYTEALRYINQISNIGQLMGIVHQLNGKRVVCALDWDNTISRVNGCNFPLRDRETLPVTQALNDMNITWFILTSRYGGISVDDPAVQEILTSRGYLNTRSWSADEIFNECVRWSVEELHESLPSLKEQSLKGFVGLNPPDVQTVRLSHYTGSEPALVYGSVVYSGPGAASSNKGRSVIKLMANGVIPTANMFDYFIFVDNDIMHLSAMVQAFTRMGILDKLIALHYPQEPLLEVGDGGVCQASLDLLQCLRY